MHKPGCLFQIRSCRRRTQCNAKSSRPATLASTTACRWCFGEQTTSRWQPRTSMASDHRSCRLQMERSSSISADIAPHHRGRSAQLTGYRYFTDVLQTKTSRAGWGRHRVAGAEKGPHRKPDRGGCALLGRNNDLCLCLPGSSVVCAGMLREAAIANTFLLIRIATTPAAAQSAGRRGCDANLSIP